MPTQYVITQIKWFNVGLRKEKYQPYFDVLSMWALGCLESKKLQRMNWLGNPRANDAQGLDNPWRDCPWELDSSQSKIFALELDIYKWELNTWVPLKDIW